jgi:xanthine dehydrogenase accessory factor
MALSDAWYDGSATLDGVEARRADRADALLRGMRSMAYLPVLPHPADKVPRWRWDIVVDARAAPDHATRRIKGLAALTISLVPGVVAGSDCDLAIETGGPNPGAVIKVGSALTTPRSARWENPISAPATGHFMAKCRIGDKVARGDVLGFVGVFPVMAADSGRMLGLVRDGHPVTAGDIIAEITSNPATLVSGIANPDQMMARAVEFAIELEVRGWMESAPDDDGGWTL